MTTKVSTLIHRDSDGDIKVIATILQGTTSHDSQVAKAYRKALIESLRWENLNQSFEFDFDPKRDLDGNIDLEALTTDELEHIFYVVTYWWGEKMLVVTSDLETGELE